MNTNGNDHEYVSKYYKLIAIDLSKQIDLENPDIRDRTLSMQEGGPESFCGGHEIFQAYIDGP